jgi:hypothetical protein
MLTRRALLLAAAAAAVVAACGPSSTQLKQAREARYEGSRDDLFMAVVQAVEQDHEIDKLDHERGALLTKGRWHEPDGTFEDSSDVNRMQSGSVFLGMLVRLDGAEPPYRVLVEASADQVRDGYSAPYHFKPDDPQLPGWVIGKVEDLQLKLHERLKGRLSPPPGGAPAAPPASASSSPSPSY